MLANLAWMSSILRLGANVTAEGKNPGLAIPDLAKTTSSFVEFETSPDLKTAVEKLDNREFKGASVHCAADVSHIPTVSAYSIINRVTGASRDPPLSRQQVSITSSSWWWLWAPG